MNSNTDHQTLLLASQRLRLKAGILLVMGLFFVAATSSVRAASSTSPYFAALKADQVHVRKGPGYKYDIVWTYRSLGLPVEITGTHEHWRRVRDSAGAEGWIYFKLLSALRMALIAPWQKDKSPISLRKNPETDSSIVARLEPGVKVLAKLCTGSWCLVSVGGFKGWIAQTRLWGVYPGEKIQ